MNFKTYYGRRIVELRTDTHRAVVHFFENHESSIRELQEDEYFDILLLYLDALFACGEYERFDSYVDKALMLALDQRIYTLKDEDIYEHLLFRKAAAVYNKGHYDQCRHLLTELIRLNPEHSLGRRFLRRCLVQSQHLYRQRLYAVVIALVLASVTGIALEILWIRPFMSAWVSVWELGRTMVFLAALCVWAGGLFWMEYRAARHVGRMERERNKIQKDSHRVSQPS